MAVSGWAKLDARTHTMTLPGSSAKSGKTSQTATEDVSNEKLWIVFRRAYQSVVELLEIGVTARGVALSDFIVLEVLLNKGELTASEIAQMTRLAAASVELTVARLKEQHLIHQQAQHTFKLSDQGRGMIDWIYEKHVGEIGSIFNILSGEQRRDLYQSLRRLGHSAARRRVAPPVNQMGSLTPWQLRRATEYMREHLSGPVTTKEIAASIELSDSHFRRAFKSATGVTPHRWLLGVRISEAQKLLKEGVVPLSEIALVTGFGDQSHFSRTFQKVIGVSPRVWQRDHDLQ